MRGNNKEKQYWDSCLFISWLKGGKDRTSKEYNALKYQIERFERKETIIIVSTLIHVEVLNEIKHQGISTSDIEDILKKKNIQRISMDIKIAKKSGELRNESLLQDKNIKTPDAIHIATAIIHKADVFYTYDTKLLRITNKDMKYSFRITEPPMPPQGSMSF